MGVNVNDLPPAVRERVLGQAKVKPRAKKSRAGVGDGQPCPGRCSCGEVFEKFTAWERHWSPGCRWIIDIDPS